MFRTIHLTRFQGSVNSACRKAFLAGLALALALFIPHPLLAQSTTGQLTGIVKDTTGGIIPGATVKLTNAKDKSSVRVTKTSGDAFFSFAALQVGTYNLTVSFPGFENYVVSGIEIHAGDNRTVEKIALAIGRVDDTVTVTALQAGVDVSSPELSRLITADDIQRLSTVGRDASELIRILPGFAVAGAGLNNDSTNNASQVAGFTGSSLGSFAANGAAPGAGAVAVITDGVNTTDPADGTSSIGNANMEMVAEVKVQTSNFGADSANGPVVISAVSKSGGSNYHGAVYGYARNSALNSNDWIDNYFLNPRASTYNYFPGANVGGPVKIPGTNFNRAKKLTFFAAGEVYDQRNLYGNTATLSFVPTQQMLGGDLSNQSIDHAFNLPAGASLALCNTAYGSTGLNNTGACYSPAATTQDVQGHAIVNGQIPLADFDPDVSSFTRFYPKPNRLPQPQNAPASCTQNIYNAITGISNLAIGSLCSDSINYDANIFGQHNGYQLHGRVDENFTDVTKLYVTYDFEHVSDQYPVTNGGYPGSPQNVIPSPTGELTYANSQRLSINNTHTFGPTLTNELTAAGVYYRSPAQLQNNGLLRDANTGFNDPRYYTNGDNQLPQIINFQGGVPDFAMSYFDPGYGSPKHKVSLNAGDNLSKQIKTHFVKVGAYIERSENDEYLANYNDPQGQLSFAQYNTCNVYATNGTAALGFQSNLGNDVGAFLNGCSNFQQVNNFQSGNMKYTTIDFYATDEWKATKKLTLTYGIRFDDLGPWMDVHGNGLAVWEPQLLNQHQLYNLNPNDPTTWPGLQWKTGKGITANPNLPLSGRPGTSIFYSPRAGLAYDLYGNGKTTFRGGWGAYRYHDNYYNAVGPLLTSLGLNIYNTNNNLNESCTLAQVGNSAAQGAGQPLATLGTGPYLNGPGQACGLPYTPLNIQATDKNDKELPLTNNYNFTVDQQVGRGTSLEVSYVGNTSIHQVTGGSGIGYPDGDLSNQNAIPLGGLFTPDPDISSPNYGGIAPPYNIGSNPRFNLQDWRPYPNYNGLLVQNHIAYSNYNAMQLSITKQSGALTYNINYTWSKAMGIRGINGNGSVGDSLNLRNNYGILPYNRNNAVNFTFSYQEGTKYHGNKYLAGALNQWEISSITALQSGPDIAAFNANFNLYGGYTYQLPGSTVLSSEQFSGAYQLGTPSVTVQPVLTCNPSAGEPHIVPGPTKVFVNGSCFALPAPGTNGSFKLPDIHGPSYFNSDITLVKNFKIKERQNLQFRLAGFNYLNHPNWQLYGGPATGLGLSFGQNLALNNQGVVNYPTSAAAAVASLVQTSTNFGATPYKSSLRIVELGFRYAF